MNKLLSTALLATILSTSGFATGDIVIEDRSSLPLTAESGQTTGLVKQNIKIKEGGLLDIQADVQLGDATTAVVVDMQSGSKFQFNKVGADEHYAKVSNVNGTIKLGFPVLSTVVETKTTSDLDGSAADKAIPVDFSNNNTSAMLGKIDQNYVSAKVTGKIEIVGIDGLTYTGATSGYSLADVATSIANLNKAIITATSQKELESSGSSDAKFTVKSGTTYYSIPVPTIPTVQYSIADGNNAGTYTLANKLAAASDAATGLAAMTDMGITVKKTAVEGNDPEDWDSKSVAADGTGWAWTADSIGTKKIDALAGSTGADAVLLKKITIDVDKAISTTTGSSGALDSKTIVTVAGNLHNLASVTVDSDTDNVTDVTYAKESNTIVAPTFSGTTNYLKLTGNNRYLNGAKFNCPVAYTSATAMAGGTYSKDLVIADNVTIDSDTTIDASNLSIASGKTVTVKGGATLTLILEPVS